MLQGCRSPSRWRNRKMSAMTASRDSNFTLSVSQLSTFAKSDDRRRVSDTAALSSPSRRLRGLRAERTSQLAESLFSKQEMRRVTLQRKTSDEQDASGPPQVDLTWTAIDFRYVKCGSTVSSLIQFKSNHTSALIVRLTLDSQREQYSSDEIKPMVQSEAHINEELKKDLLASQIQNSQFKKKLWVLEDPKTKTRQKSVSVFLKPKAEVGVKVLLKMPVESVLGSLKTTVVDVVTMGGKKLRHQHVFLMARAQIFPVIFSNQIYSDLHKARVIPLIAKYSLQSEIIKKYKLTLTNSNIYDSTQLKLFPMLTLGDQLANKVDILFNPTTLTISQGCMKTIEVYIRMKRQKQELEARKILKAMVGVSSTCNFVYGLYLEIQILKE